MCTTAFTAPLHAPRDVTLPMPWLMLGTFVVTHDCIAINATAPALRDALCLALAARSPAQAAGHVMLALLAIGVAWLLRGWRTLPQAATEPAR